MAQPPREPLAAARFSDVAALLDELERIPTKTKKSTGGPSQESQFRSVLEKFYQHYQKGNPYVLMSLLLPWV
jgi:hypothetical protein